MILKTLSSICALALMAGGLFAQSTDIAINSTVLQPSVKRFGINLGNKTFYDSGQMMKNLIERNPGFEGQLWNSIVRCVSGTATTCQDEDVYSAWPARYWNGASFEVVWGAAAGRKGTIESSTAASNNKGITLKFDRSGVAPALGDEIVLRKAFPGGASQGWWPYTSGKGTVSDNRTDLPPGTTGQQTISLSARNSSDQAGVASYFDSTAGRSFVRLNGTYQLSFKAKATGGPASVALTVLRYAATNLNYLQQNQTLTSHWATYNIPVTINENSSAVGVVKIAFATVGASSLLLDDVSFSELNTDPANTTVFRDPVVNALKTLQPGILRFWANQLGDTLDNLLAPPFGRQRAGYYAGGTSQEDTSYGLHEFLQLCKVLGAEPWIVVPTTFSTTDSSHLIEYLAGSTATPYGGKRTALGQMTPWNQVFPKIHLEFGNEAWNSIFAGARIPYPAPYGQRAQAIFAAMRGNPSYAQSSFDLVLGGQAGYTGRNLDIQNNCNNNDSFAIAPYTMSTVDSFSDIESLFGPTFAEPEAFMSRTGTADGMTPGTIFQNYQAIQGSRHPVPLSFYEINMNTLNGSISQAALNSYATSLGAGLMVADTMLQSLRKFGVVNQGLFSLPQHTFRRSDGKTVYLFGAVVDMGVTDLRRPQFLALQLANQALSNGAAMLETVHTGLDPTWNQPLVNTVQLNGAHFLQSFAFQHAAERSLIVFNLSRTASLPVTFSGNNAPGGTLQLQQLTSAHPGDTNESSKLVNITSSTFNSFNPGAALWLPPYSMSVLTWSTAK